MIKKFCFGLILLVFPAIVFAEDYLTITYDANDGTGRTKIVQLLKGGSYTTEPGNIFEFIDPNPDDPMDDMVLYYWNTKSDGSGKWIDIKRTYDGTGSYVSYLEIYNLFENSDNITLYGKWKSGRTDVKPGIKNKSITGAAAVPTGDDSYNISHTGSFFIEFTIKENVNFQIAYLNYLELPDYFIEYLDDEPEIRSYLEQKRSFTTSINYSSGIQEEINYFYLKGNKLCIDIPPDNRLSNIATNLKIIFNLEVSITEKIVNEHVLLGKTVVVNDLIDEALEIYPKGNILVKYIDIDTGEEFDSVSTSDLIGTYFSPTINDYEGYKLVSDISNNNYEYEENDQVIILKYQKAINAPEEHNEDITEDTSNKIENPNTASYFPLVYMLLSLLTGTILFIIFINKDKIKKIKYK